LESTAPGGTIPGAMGSTFTVDCFDDVVDAAPGDGSCDTGIACVNGTGQCTLRASVQEASAHPGDDVILLPAGIFKLTLPGADEDLGATGDLDVFGDGDPTTPDNLTITGAGADQTFINANGSVTGDRAFDVDPADQEASLTVSGISIFHGQPSVISSEGG